MPVMFRIRRGGRDAWGISLSSALIDAARRCPIAQAMSMSVSNAYGVPWRLTFLKIWQMLTGVLTPQPQSWFANGAASSRVRAPSYEGVLPITNRPYRQLPTGAMEAYPETQNEIGTSGFARRNPRGFWQVSRRHLAAFQCPDRNDPHNRSGWNAPHARAYARHARTNPCGNTRHSHRQRDGGFGSRAQSARQRLQYPARQIRRRASRRKMSWTTWLALRANDGWRPRGRRAWYSVNG